MIIATDLDGTLISSDTSISNENLGAIKRLSEYGAHIVLVTGRTFYEILPQLTDCPYIDYFVYSNGACIYKQGSGLAFSNCMPPARHSQFMIYLIRIKPSLSFTLTASRLLINQNFVIRDLNFIKYRLRFCPSLKEAESPLKI